MPETHLRRALVLDRVDIGLLFSTPAGKRTLAQLETAPTIAAACALVLGAALCTVGARFRKHTVLGCAFLDGAVAVSLALAKLHVLRESSSSDSSNEWTSVVSWVCFVLGGALLCVIVLAHDALGRFVVGATAGAMLACASHTTFGIRLHAAHPWIPLTALVSVLAPTCGFLSVRFPHAAMISATSWIGANAIAWGAGYFIGDYPSATALLTAHATVPRAWWSYIGATIGCCALGCVIQHCVGAKTKREPHDQRRRRRRQRQQQQTPLSPERYAWLSTPRGAQTHPAPLTTESL